MSNKINSKKIILTLSVCGHDSYSHLKNLRPQSPVKRRLDPSRTLAVITA
jgi:hypothetical protein